MSVVRSWPYAQHSDISVYLRRESNQIRPAFLLLERERQCGLPTVFLLLLRLLSTLGKFGQNRASGCTGGSMVTPRRWASKGSVADGPGGGRRLNKRWISVQHVQTCCWWRIPAWADRFAFTARLAPTSIPSIARCVFENSPIAY